MAVRREYVADLYRSILKREGSEEDITGHLNNPGGEKGLYDLFMSVAGNNSDGQVNEATTGSTQQQNYQSDYQVQGASEPPSGSNPPGGGGRIIPEVGVTGPTTTDQWSGPGSVAPGGNFSALAGFDWDNFNNANMQTAKYQNARIFGRYDPRGGASQLLNDPDFRRLFPNAKVVDVDKVDYGDGRPVDVIQDYGGANPRWAWQTQDGGASSSGTGSGGGSRTGGSSTLGDLRSLYGALGQQYGGPGGAGITNGPLQQVGQDPLSQLITGALAAFIGNEGKTRFGGDVEAALAGLLDRGGELDAGQTARRYESARELLDKGRRTMISDLEGDLVDRNLLSEPGIPQGAHSGGLKRVTEAIAPEFSRALRDIYTDEAAKADARLMTSLQMATGMASDQARNLLASIGEGTARQGALADIALRSLQTNMAWSQFLAEFGLKRDQVMYEMENGNIEQFLPILQAFIQLGGMANQGYV